MASWSPAASLPSPSAPAEHPAGATTIEKLGFAFLGLFLVLIYSRLFESRPLASLHLPLISGAATLAIAAASGNLGSTLRFSLTRLMLLFTVWMILCVPFAYWRRGSLTVLVDHWLKSFLVFVLIATLVRTLPQLRRVCLLLLVAIAAAATWATIQGAASWERLALGEGEFANANQFAMVCMMGVPIAIAVIADMTRPAWLRLLSAGILVLLGATILRTGSRSGLLALLLLGIVCLTLLPLAGRILAIVTMAAGALLAIQLLPPAVLTRFSTFLTPTGEYQSVLEAQVAMSTGESAQGRLQVAKDALRYTLETPLLGLGPGNFINRRNQEYHDKYGRHGWLETHNAYLQVLTEMGVPGLLIFAGIFASAYRLAKRAQVRLKQARQREDIQLRHQALGLRLMILVMALFCLFNHIAYDFYLPTIFGLALALDRVASTRLPAPAAQMIPVSGAAFQAPRFAAPVLAPAPRAASSKPRLNGSPRRYAAAPPAERR